MFDFVKKQLIALGISFLLSYTEKIKFDPLKVYLQYLGFEVQQVVEVLLDKNKDDSAQLKAVWQAEKNNFIANTIQTTAIIAESELKDEKVKFVVKGLLRDLQTVLTTGVVPPNSNLARYVKEVKSGDDIIL